MSLSSLAWALLSHKRCFFLCFLIGFEPYAVYRMPFRTSDLLTKRGALFSGTPGFLLTSCEKQCVSRQEQRSIRLSIIQEAWPGTCRKQLTLGRLEDSLTFALYTTQVKYNSTQTSFEILSTVVMSILKEWSVLKHAIWLLWHFVSRDEQEKVLEAFPLLILHNHTSPSTLCSVTQGNQVYSGSLPRRHFYSRPHWAIF